ncbi:HNH endonuclease [Enterobacter cloacae]
MSDRSKRVPLPEQSELEEHFRYDHSTGLLWRKIGGFNRDLSKPCGVVTGSGYLAVRHKTIAYTVHRLIWKIVHGTEPQHIDHINGNRTDNRICNLRAVSRHQNNRNICITKANKSGYIGVRFDERSKKWTSQIKINRKAIHVGTFDSKKEAVVAYNETALALHGDSALRKVEFNREKLIKEFGGIQ